MLGATPPSPAAIRTPAWEACRDWLPLATAEAFFDFGPMASDPTDYQEDTSAPSCASTTGSGFPRSGSSAPTARPVGIVRPTRPCKLAQEADLDLVEVAPHGRPPVCKLMDYGKFKYENAQKAREARRNQTNVVIKEMKLRPKIDAHDYETKKGHVVRFLRAGDKVKITIMFRGREQHRPELGFRLLQRLAEDVDGARLRRVLAQAGRPQHDHGARPAQEEGRGQGRAEGREGDRRPPSAPPTEAEERAERDGGPRRGPAAPKKARGRSENLDPEIEA